MIRTAPFNPVSHSVGSRVKPLICCLDDFYGQHCARSFCDRSRTRVKWSVDVGLSVTSRLLDSLTKFLRAGGRVRL